MLIKFSVENFWSFRDETTFDMIPTNIEDDTKHIHQDDTGKKTKTLPISLIFGANASGKSNLFSAMLFAASLIKRGQFKNNRDKEMYFRLNKEYSEKPTSFEFTFKTNGSVYVYGFSIFQNIIVHEWFYRYCKDKIERNIIRKLFEIFRNKGKTKINFGNDLFSGKDLKAAGDWIPENNLFLDFAKEKNENLKEAHDWFAKKLLFNKGFDENFRTGKKIYSDSDFSEFASSALEEIDTGIRSIECEKITRKAEDLFSEYTVPNGFRVTIPENFPKNVPFYKLSTRHMDNNGEDVVFDLGLESNGTISFLNLLPLFYELKNPEITIVMDEFDSSLHPLLSQWIVERGIETVVNLANGSQMILVTHDANLLNRKILRRDEIWFVSKDKSGASSLTRLSEFEDNKDLDIENGYLNGRFWGVPNLNNYNGIFHVREE